MKTPGTLICWSDLAGWIAAAETLERRKLRRCSTPTRIALEAHWAALPEAWARQGDAATTAAFVALLGLRPVRAPWERPGRGWRAGKWERVNVLARNRLAQIARDADRASIGIGHNARAAGLTQLEQSL